LQYSLLLGTQGLLTPPFCRDLEESSQTTEDELTARGHILKEDLHDADRRADNSERQVNLLLFLQESTSLLLES